MARGGLIAALAGLFLLAHGASALTGAFERKSLGSRFTPSHGEITHVPGFQGPLPSKHYGGYITVDEAAGRHLYYYVALSESDPAGDPVLLWLNGGPGCSSFDGFLYEHGPFNFQFTDESYSRLRLTANPFAWNKAATVVFLDSPAGVGLSYSETPGDYVTNDTQTAADTEVFLRRFFERYPELREQDFYITGESYAGIYVPNAVRAVVEGNRKGREPAINIQGYLVGNGCTDAEFDGNALPPFAAGKSLISQRMYSKLDRDCDGNYWKARDDGDCAARLADIQEDLSALNIYDILEPCRHGPKPPAPSPSQPAGPSHLQPASASSSSSSSAASAGGGAGAEVAAGAAFARALREREQLRARAAERYSSLLRTHRGWPVTGAVPDGRVANWAQLMGGLSHAPPCTDDSEGSLWLNDPAVRSALHAAPIDAVGAPWTVCSDRIIYTHDAGSMIWIHREMTQKRGLRALIYSGDHDMAVPHTGTEAWTAALGLKKRSGWQPWYVGSPRQVAGYRVEYEGLTFATIKGAGHMVPQNKPAESLAMLQRFLSGETL
ncbi:serine carboxypeptidase-like [Raphidocelis subcapitata]|uniref:Carboxypeptidase n=1 Tax=Raphidocelis subcapitata TaxID=307507 RepID=A0A2V0PAV2_9CHLO|nr:serine carboxypeptidase-like [Raphidocelis subcapitata]|eukprot:GBF96984.1 serine carboxypeptidase-like [Raphidocelis subcapitata]